MKTKFKTIIFGAGYHGRNALRKCNKNNSLYSVVYFLDNDNKKKKLYS